MTLRYRNDRTSFCVAESWGDVVAAQTMASLAVLVLAASIAPSMAQADLLSDTAALQAVALANPNFDPDGKWRGDPCGDSWPGITCNLSRVVTLDLGNRGIAGPIPLELGQLSELTSINLGPNSLSGPIPAEILTLPSLTYLNLGTNNLSGSLPPTLGNLSRLQSLFLDSNHLTGPIPPTLGGLQNLKNLYLHDNALTGAIPSTLGGLQSLEKLDLHSNALTGPVPAQFGNLSALTDLVLYNNKLTGSIPPEIGSLPSLRLLDISQNNLNGSIPPALGGLPSLEKLFLQINALAGLIPPTLASLSALLELDLSGCQLFGAIPPALGDLLNLTYLNLGVNALTGPIPPELSKLVALKRLNLGTNMLTGTIPPGIGTLSGLEYLTLDTNNLTGSIPFEFGHLLDLKVLFLDFNNLTGPILDTLGSLQGLQALHLHDNSLTGPIPLELGSLKNLMSLLLQDNGLTGIIPPELRSLPSNSTVNLTNNYLKGPLSDLNSGRAIPFLYDGNCLTPEAANQRSNMSCADIYASLETPAQAPLVASPGPTGDGSSTSVTLLVGAVLGGSLAVAVAAAVGLAVFLRWQRMRKLAGVTIQDTHVQKWKLSELRAATNNFDEALILGKGGYGTVYKGQMDDIAVAVKRLKEHRFEADGYDAFVKEVLTVGSIHNRNLVALRGYCIEGGECLLVYDYMANGSLEDWLFGQESHGPLDWQRCVNILVGTANGIAYLHEGCKEKIIHRDIKPANILLDDNFAAHVADFGLARSTLVADTHVSTRVAGTMGYLAPEYVNTWTLTEKSDVYSFGVLCLVVVAHRPAVVHLGDGNFDGIVEKAHKAAREEQMLCLVASHLSDSYDEVQAKRIISIALLCTQPSWKDRPSMGLVVQMLKNNAAIPSVDFKAIAWSGASGVSAQYPETSSSNILG